ncbi:MAG: VanZ family protein [Leucobacter sp.]
MLATILVGYPWLTPSLLVCFIAASLFLARWLLPRRRLTWALLAAAVAVVLALVFWPTGREMTVSCATYWSIPHPRAVEPFANLVLFVPPVFFAAVLARRLLLAAIGGSAASAAIELTQALIPALGRSCATNDWVANSLGALIGAALAWAAIAIATRQARPSPRSPQARPLASLKTTRSGQR